jgi:uncharacterized protein YbbC (DUF1343 family)
LPRAVEAGAKVGDRLDAKTGVPVFSLYGASKKPAPRMLRNVDVLVFDIQDIGTRFYTYISTMGLAMQAAAAARIPFIVLDRPNPLGGDYVSGFVPGPGLPPRSTTSCGWRMMFRQRRAPEWVPPARCPTACGAAGRAEGR